VNENQVKMKTKRENEKDEERKNKTSIIISHHTVKTIMLTLQNYKLPFLGILLPYLFHLLMILNT